MIAEFHPICQDDNELVGYNEGFTLGYLRSPFQGGNPPDPRMDRKRMLIQGLQSESNFLGGSGHVAS